MPDERPLVLAVDDEASVREVLELRLRSWGYPVVLARDGEEAVRAVREHDPAIVITDVVLPSLSGLELLAALREGDPHRPVILITAHGSVESAVTAMKQGATDFLTKPLDYGHLSRLLEEVEANLAEHDRVRRTEGALERGRGPAGIVGRGPPMRELFEIIERLAAADASALITGESGTGKERVARAIHELSARREGPFVAVNAAAIPEGLMESELFGHEKGAFTGAQRSRPGCFEMADGGTLLLDEIAEMPAALQPKLLRILEDGSTRRLGGTREVGFDVRVLAATNQDTSEAMEEGRLREDLFFRLAVFQILVPPLRQRPGDLPLLVHQFVEELNEKHGFEVVGVRERVRELLAAYGWPGNVRELRNVIERATILARRGWIEEGHLPPHLRERPEGPGANGRDPGDDLVLPLGLPAQDVERRYLLATLEATGNNKAAAARRLGVDVKTIRNKLKAWGLH